MSRKISPEQLARIQERYQSAMHQIQTAVMLGISRDRASNAPGEHHMPVQDTHECSPKHLRVGVDSALASSEALASLLVYKGLASVEEVQEAMAGALEDRADIRLAETRAQYGPNVSLG
jgi:hypothetical protein